MLALNPLQIYFARYPTAEPLTQYFTWMGLWCFTSFVTYRPHRPLWGVAAGLALGQVFLARIDALPMLLLPGAWFCYLFVSRRWRWDEAWFWGSYAAVTLLAFFHGFWYSLPYTFNSYSVVFALAPRYFWLAAIGVILVIGSTFWLRKRLTRGVTGVQRLFMGRPVRVTAVALLALLAIYGYFIRPQLGAPALVDYWYAQVQIPISDHENLVRLGWYLTPLGIVLATAGFGVLIMYGPWRFLWPWAIIGGVFTFLYLFAILNNPLQILRHAALRASGIAVAGAGRGSFSGLALGAPLAPTVGSWRRSLVWRHVVGRCFAQRPSDLDTGRICGCQPSNRSLGCPLPSQRRAAFRRSRAGWPGRRGGHATALLIRPSSL